MKSLPDLTRVNGFTYGESDLILDPKSPMRSARRLLQDRYTTIDAAQLLHHHRGEFYGWTGERYAEITDQYLTSDIYHFLEYAKRTGDKGKLQVFEPNRARVGEVHSALKAATYLGDSLQAPMWLGEAVPDLSPHEIVACRNGLLHLPTRDLLPHTPYFFTHNSIDFPYDPVAAEPTRWFEFLRQLWPADPDAIQTLKEIFGYCLVSDTSQQKAFLLVGPKRSGKGTIARILEAVIGAHNVVAPTINGISTNFGMAPLIGKRLAIISDARIGHRTDTTVVAERLLAVTGEDAITLDRKNREAWTGTLDVKFIIISNELPKIADASGALPSRFIILIMKNSFFGNEDRGLTKTLLAERPGILNWAIEGYADLVSRGYFIQPKCGDDAVRELEELASPSSAFLRDRCTIEAGRTVEVNLLFAEWQNWCEDQNRDAVGTKQSFGRTLKTVLPWLTIAQFTNTLSGGRDRYYQGLGLRRSDDP